MEKQEFDKMMKESFGERVENISSKPNRTVTVSTRAVYHRYGEVTIDIPDNVKSEEIVNWLNDNEYLYEEDIDKKVVECKPELGFGFREGMCEKNAVVETRYDVYCKSQYLKGGHL